MLRVVADTNIYISAVNFGGVPDQVLALARRGRVDLFISKPILDEIEGVLKRKFQWPPTRVRAALTAIGEFARTVEPQERIAVVKKDEPDNRVLECALAAKAAVVVSGDSHLRDLGSFRGVRILSPRAFLDMIGG
ncbi:MAG: putative toxin-antitoxin system toxin component, PIN family [Candidatus Binatales bacterium]